MVRDGSGYFNFVFEFFITTYVVDILLNLPSGLKLSSNGVISGTPYEKCEKSITIKAIDKL